MKMTVFSIVAIAMMLCSVSGCGPSGKLSVGERHRIIGDMESETLARLYSEHPDTKNRVKKAAGYGVFSNANINLFVISGGSGYGVVVNNSTGRRTYMKMALGGIGLGLGVKDYRQVLIFNSKDLLAKFIESGWEFGGHADAAAKAGQAGGEVSGTGAIGADIEAYSMTESGLALQATIAGTKYWKDKNLN
jgi:lipid-binding SYLF domain-containing protein